MPSKLLISIYLGGVNPCSLLGGELQSRLMPADGIEYDRCIQMGIEDPYKVLSMEDMIGKEDVIIT